MREEEHLYSGYTITTWLMLLRTSSSVNSLQTMAGIVSRMLNTFVAAGHHQHAKGAQLYCQLIKQLESLPDYKEIFENFTAYRNHIVRYSCHDWSGTWCCGICIEQRLMKAAKSEGGLSRGRMRNSVTSAGCKH